MKVVTLGISDRRSVSRRAIGALSGRRQGTRISFASAELLFRVLTTKRWEIIRTMSGVGPLSIREVARRVGRDVKAVHADVHALLDAGIVRKTVDGLVEFPFDAIRVDVLLSAA